jgi:pyruvate-ferredoxin/flavodoxin oxidoreductase
MAKEKKFMTCDGNLAASHVAYMFSEVAAIYPITPSSNMAENVDEWSASGRKNMFGDTVHVVEMQSEGGASGAVHGSLQAGALTSTYTASQGLLLMIPNMFKMAGELLPAVFHVSARSIAGHALSIFGDHSDVYSARMTGFAMLATGSIQEIMDLAGVAHLAAIKSRVPFMHFFDGFRSSHEIQKVEAIDQDALYNLIDQEQLLAFRKRAINPEHPVTRGSAQNPDIFFQAKEASNRYFDAVPGVVAEYMKEISIITGRDYKPFTYYGAPDAENVIVAMGSVTEVIKETIDMKLAKGEKVGLISVHLYRPFSKKYFFDVLPKSVKHISVLDRSKEIGTNGEPLYQDIREMFYDVENRPLIVGGRYGLSSKDTTPTQIVAVYENLAQAEPKNYFTVGIVDDVTFHSLLVGEEFSLSAEGTFEGKFYGLGSDGTVGANKNSIKIIGDNTDKYAQAYFAYDSKKSGGITISHLRFGDSPIRSTYLVTTPDFVACHVPAYLTKYDMLKGIKPNGTFLLNSTWDAEKTKSKLPDNFKKIMAQKNISFYIINATQIAEEIGLGTRTNTIMQSAFFKIANVIPYDLAVAQMKKFIVKSFGLKGEKVLNMNYEAVDKGGYVTKVEIPAEWANIELKKTAAADDSHLPDFVRNIANPVNALKGDELPVSAFVDYADGTMPHGSAAYEKRGIAVTVPQWNAETCIQCNQCAYVCPHGVIRPFLASEEELKDAPAGTVTKKGVGKTSAFQFKIQVSVLDCTGCNVCVVACPTKEKSLVMKPLAEQLHEAERWDFFSTKVGYKDTVLPKQQNLKNLQFSQPLFEFSGACAGCGETPYIKNITQMFGDRMMIANATGCSSIYGASAPSTPYTINKEGKGPAWANSLFEDNAEYGLGMALGVNKLRKRIAQKMQASIEAGIADDLKAAYTAWLEGCDDAEKSEEATKALIPVLEASNAQTAKDILSLKQYLIKKSVWIIGGDGWAYDIGYGGLDHVLASGEDVNILVMDTEVYSNTGGQSSKSSPTGSVAKFTSSGKKIRKKDLGLMATTYGYVYVAQVAMGASQTQYMKVMREAEAYKGPSLIIAYSPCIAHGLKGGMGNSQVQQKDAVDAGYWTMYRYNPVLAEQGENPFVIDSKEPQFDKFQEFLRSEVRYSSLIKAYPKEAEELFIKAEKHARQRHAQYKRMAAMNYKE